MTGYTHADLAEGWEFKILHSATGAFKKPECVRQVIEEEGRAGWVLLEKFDNQRLRLKRPASAKSRDGALGTDPYRSNYGIGEGKLAAMIIGSIISTLALAGLIIALVVHR